MAQITIEQKKKEKQLKLKKNNLKNKKNLENFSKSNFFLFKYFLSHFSLMNFVPFCWTFVGHFYPPLRNKQTEKGTEKRKNGETESSIYIAAMSQLKN